MGHDSQCGDKIGKGRSRLQQYFESCANRVGGTKTFTSDFSKLLQSALDDSFKSQVARNVVNNIQFEAWVGNWKVMRAHLDLHLVKLIEDKNTKDLIFRVRNGSSHYRAVLNALIEKAIRIELTTDLQKSFVDSIKGAVHSAAWSAKNSKSLSTFLNTLTSELSTKLKFLELAKSIGYVDEKVYSKRGNHIYFLEVEREVSPRLDVRKDIATIKEVGDIVCLVKDRMIASLSESARPQCEEECPRCKLTCFLAARHDNRHETLHQPEGLVGVTCIKSGHRDQPGELNWTSCSQCVMHRRAFFPNREATESVLYKDFSKYYPGWSLPSEGFGTVKVREYIFAHYQEELVQEYGNGILKCTEIPQEYYHDIKGLRRELENVLQRYELHTVNG